MNQEPHYQCLFYFNERLIIYRTPQFDEIYDGELSIQATPFALPVSVMI
jgi:hypothetical protein